MAMAACTWHGGCTINNIAANIQPEATKTLEPITTKKIGLIIAGVTITILLLILTTSHSNLKPYRAAPISQDLA
jgi:hypothetical protein